MFIFLFIYGIIKMQYNWISSDYNGPQRVSLGKEE